MTARSPVCAAAGLGARVLPWLLATALGSAGPPVAAQTVRSTGPSAPSVAPSPASPCADAHLMERTLQRLNALRASGLACGGAPHPAAAPLAWSDTLARAAAGHARDMAQRRQLAHAGSDGSTGGDRLQRAGYDWQQWAENLGLGARSVDELMRLWAASPLHCDNLMLPGLQDVGLACVEGSDRRPYWSMTLGTPRGPLR